MERLRGTAAAALEFEAALRELTATSAAEGAALQQAGHLLRICLHCCQTTCYLSLALDSGTSSTHLPKLTAIA